MHQLVTQCVPEGEKCRTSQAGNTHQSYLGRSRGFGPETIYTKPSDAGT